MSRNKTHLEYVEHKEYVNAKQGICVSVLTFRIKLSNLPEYDMLWDFEPLKKYINTLDHRIDDIFNEYVYWTVRGKSICSENDTFDEELGKHIALTRAQEKAFKTAGNFFVNIYNIINRNLMYKYETLGLNCFNSILKESEHVCQLTGMKQDKNKEQ